ncbi:capping complex subunit for YIEGIA [Virgibacillus oceani]|uniref:Uncharacterized protein n=1 Tax=Virgibacillus oceani TaxID=1479511 RepID=A0A917M2Y3_9BACI|nr:hypothetical protein [Virgibacillus oceani]GGG73924.1 hypothetical protein GCM10011398_18090 [Virgibacillus oceani]
MSRIVAIVSLNPSLVTGGVAIFIAKNEEEQKQIAFSLEKIMDATAHDLKNGTFILVDHNTKIT